MQNLPPLTASRLKAARACARLHHYQYVLGVRPRLEDEALRFGTLWHQALESWWSTPPAHRLDAGSSAIAEACRKSADLDPFDRVRAEMLLAGYDARWREEQFETLAVEKEFSAPLSNPTTGRPSRTWELGGKIDAIARDGDGRVWIVEHKTSSEDLAPGGEYWRRLLMDGQISTYYVGATALGYEVSGCLYDVVAKPRIRQLRATPTENRKYTKDGRLYANQREVDESPEEYALRLSESIAGDPASYYARSTVVRLEQEIADHQWDVWQIGKRIREDMLADRAPRNPDACLRYSRTCAYFDVCSGLASIDDETRFVRRGINPELSQEGPHAT
ncbi:MAG: PD-(D/E)XK nuclease family protein [Pseudomonadota bacterium]